MWISPDGLTQSNQIDHFTITRKRRASLIDARVKRGLDAASDHHLLLGTFKVKKLEVHHGSSAEPHCKYNISNLKCNGAAKSFTYAVGNQFSALETWMKT